MMLISFNAFILVVMDELFVILNIDSMLQTLLVIQFSLLNGPLLLVLVPYLLLISMGG